MTRQAHHVGKDKEQALRIHSDTFGNTQQRPELTIGALGCVSGKIDHAHVMKLPAESTMAYITTLFQCDIL